MSSQDARSAVGESVFRADSPQQSIEGAIADLQINATNDTVSTPEAGGLGANGSNSPASDTIEGAIANLQINGTGNPNVPSVVRGETTSPDNLSHARPDLNHRSSTPRTPGGQRFLSPDAESPAGRGRRRRSSSRNAVELQVHNVEGEELPELQFYNSAFQDALCQSRGLARTLAETLSSGTLHNDPSSAIHGLHEQAVEASNYSGPRKWSIGFVGDSGSGKSSLINSLLHTQGLAMTSGGGSACTSAITEFHYRDSPQFAVEVVYKSRQELLDRFEELLLAYREFHMNAAGSQEDHRDVEARRDLQERAAIAKDTFEAAFRGQGGQCLLTQTDMLSVNVQSAITRIRALVGLCAPRQCLDTSNPPVARTDAISDEATCSEHLRRLTWEPADSAEPSKWPYIERVRVFLKAHILSKGLILIDLPGLHDTNAARRNITERCIVSCDEVFTVANIGRALTDMGVAAVIELARRTRREYVGIVCTCSDLINADELVHEWPDDLADSLRELREQLEECRGEIKTIEEDLEDEDNDAEDFRALNAMLRNERRKEARYELQLAQFMVTTRNSIVVSGLRQKYAPGVRHVFCVSNRYYSSNRDEDRAMALPWLQLSNILLLRKHCLGLVADHQLEFALRFIRDSIPNLVSSIDLWVQSGSGRIAAETRAQLREVSEHVEEILQREVINVTAPNNMISQALETRFNQNIQRHFTVANYRLWQRKADDEFRVWQGWHHMTFSAFCRNYGEHSTPGAGGHHCWNREATDGMTTTLTGPWEQLGNNVHSFFENRNRSIELAFERALNLLRAINLAVSDRDNFDALQTLNTSLLQRKALLRNDSLSKLTDFERALRQLGKVDLMSGIRSSFTGEYMEEAYRATIREYGTGSDKRRKNIIEHRITSQELFITLQQSCETRFHTLAGELEEEIYEVNRTHFGAIRNALDTLRTENAVLDAERDPGLRARLRDQVAIAQTGINNITAAIAESASVQNTVT